MVERSKENTINIYFGERLMPMVVLRRVESISVSSGTVPGVPDLGSRPHGIARVQVPLLGEQDGKGDFLGELQRDMIVLDAHHHPLDFDLRPAPETEEANDGILQLGEWLSRRRVA